MTMSTRGRIRSNHPAPHWDDDDTAHVPSWRKAMRRTVKRSERQHVQREIVQEILDMMGT